MTTCDLADFTTLRLGGPAHDVIEVRTEQEFVENVRSADRAGSNLLLISGGSNLVISDDGFDGRVIIIRTGNTGIDADHHARRAGQHESGTSVTVAAGQNWDEFVAHAVGQQWSGLEALSGIPGSVGATPIQNVGAYGQDVANTIESVRVWDRRTEQIRALSPAECGFGYRSSLFKADPEHFLVLAVTFRLQNSSYSSPVAYAELARRLDINTGERAPLHRVRQTVLELRGEKGMVLNEADHDTWSVGSFFTNPVLRAQDAADLPEDAPRFAHDDGRVKTSAAWLIERSGFSRGYGNARVCLSAKHTLALTNRGAGTTSELLDLARTVRDGVYERFAITLVNEPFLVGCHL